MVREWDSSYEEGWVSWAAQSFREDAFTEKQVRCWRIEVGEGYMVGALAQPQMSACLHSWCQLLSQVCLLLRE